MTSTLQPLPHAPIGMVFGLLEHLRESVSGREDLYKLGGPLGNELDDLLPVIEVSKALGLVHVDSGDIELTLEGREISRAEEPERKRLLAPRLLTLPLIAHIREALEARADGRVPKKVFQELLEVRYSPEEAQRQISTAVDWARYGELFDFSPDSQEFVLGTLS